MGRPGLLSAPVLLGAALVSSPALWRGLAGEGSPTVAMTRFLVSIGLCWVGLSVVAALVGPPPRPEPSARDHGNEADGPDRSE